MTARSQSTRGVVESLNVGTPSPVELNGHEVLTAIWKHPVTGRVPLRGVNLRGDDQADRTVHGGPDKAVYAYAREDIEWWETELERTLTSALVSRALLGERHLLSAALKAPELPADLRAWMQERAA